MKTIVKDKLVINIYDNRAEMGKAAGSAAGKKIRELLTEKEEVNIIFAAAPSQNETLETLLNEEGIEWNRVNAFHMDEYIGLAEDAPQGFGNFLKDHIFGKLPFGRVEYINGQAEDMETECQRYAGLLQQYPTDLVLLGIGENGHIAFNDPHVADFQDPKAVKAVALDQVCRQQQVNDGCFVSLDEVPEYALTLTIPALVRAETLICTVPAKTKAAAVKNTVMGEISEECPATIMRLHENAVMYCDKESGSGLL